MFFMKKKTASTEEPIVADDIHNVKPVRNPKPIKVVVVWSAFVLVIAGSLGTAGYFYHAYKSISNAAADEVANVSKSVGTIYAVPTDETPTLATVSDKQKLSNEKFFAKAENGDKVLIYTKAGQAILYRPSAGKIINVAPVNMTDQSTAPAATDQATPTVAGAETAAQPATDQAAAPVAAQAQAPAPAVAPAERAKVALYNGTTKVGLTAAFQGTVTGAFPTADVTVKESASLKNYDKTIVVDVTGKQSALAAEMAAKYGTTAAVIPAGETKPDADILIILGKDRM